MGAQEEAYTLQLRARLIRAADSERPAARAAHNLVARTTGDGSSTILLLAGDSCQPCQRFNDLWQLCGIGAHPQWRQLLCSCPSNNSRWRSGATAGSSGTGSSSCTHYCTARSNGAAAIAGDWLVVFGGWSASGLHPLADLQVLNISNISSSNSSNSSSSSSPAWQMPAATGCSPSPRGQPAAAADTPGRAVYLFGGFDGRQRYGDLFRLQLPQQPGADWHWELVTAGLRPAAANDTAGRGEAAAAAASEVIQPCARADHVMVYWHYCDDGRWKDLLVVFAGSSEGGLLNDLWLFDCSSNSWTQGFCGGAAPCARSSCAAAITGDVMLLHGGQTPGGVLHDMHLLHLSNLTWVGIDLGPVLQPLCRHSIAIADKTCWLFGGFDGSSCCDELLQIDLQPVLQLQRSSLQDLAGLMACCGSGEPAEDHLPRSPAAAAVGASAAGATGRLIKVLSKKASPAPPRLSDLPNAAEAAALPRWKQIRLLHQAAVAAGCDSYIDPATGYTVFTAGYLRQRQCCGNKCRHCPHGWENVRGLVSQQQGGGSTSAALPEW